MSDFGGLIQNTTLIERGLSSFIDTIDPDSSGDFSHYKENLAGFIENELNVDFITDDQRLVIESAMRYTTTVVKSATGVGKTFIGAALAIAFYKSLPKVQIYTAAAPPEANLKRLLWGEINHITEKEPSLFENDKVSSLSISRPGKNWIEGVTIPTTGTEKQREAKFSGKHHEAIIFIVDEGDAVPDEVYRAIDGCMSGGFVRLIIFYNPKIKTGEVYRKVREQRANVITMSALTHPNVIKGRDIVKGAVTQEVTAKRIVEWSEPVREDEEIGADCFEVPRWLVGIRAEAENGTIYPPIPKGWRRVSDPQMYYKVLGEYPTEGTNQLIPQKFIDLARSRWDAYVAEKGRTPPIGVRGRNGLDVAEFGIDSNVFCSRYGTFVDELVTWGGIDTDLTAQRGAKEHRARISYDCIDCQERFIGGENADEAKAHRLRQDHRVVKFEPYTFVDAIGVGAGVSPRMQREKCNSVTAIKVSEKSDGYTLDGNFNLLRDELLWYVREWLIKDLAMLPPNKKLIDALMIITYEETGGSIKVMGKKTMKRILGYSPDELDALALTFSQPSTDFGTI